MEGMQLQRPCRYAVLPLFSQVGDLRLLGLGIRTKREADAGASFNAGVYPATRPYDQDVPWRLRDGLTSI